MTGQQFTKETVEIILAMVLAAIQSDNKDMSKMSPEEVQYYIDEAVKDYKIAVEAING